MPIRPENRALYPADWPDISRRCRERAGNRCEFCDIPNHQLGAWIEGKWHVAWAKGSGEHDRPRRGEVFPCHRGDVVIWRKVSMVILTAAHMNHRPEDCADENLKALCQRCHLIYDAPSKHARRLERERAGAAAADLFEVV